MDGAERIPEAVARLRAGELVAFPTETVYGLGADARNASAVARIFELKGRPADHPLIVHLAGAPHLRHWARDIPALAWPLAEAFWPGPLTLILKRGAGIPDAVTGGQDSIGLRVPDHALALELLAAFAGGVAAPSANRFGRISPTTAAHVRHEFGATTPFVLDGGPCAVGIESTIVDLTRSGVRILRPGAITAEDLGYVVGADKMMAPAPGGEDDAAPRVSGTLATHYAPRTPLLRVAPERLDEEVRARLVQGLRVAVLARRAAPVHDPKLTWQHSLPGAAAYAHDLYAHLRVLDAAGAHLILVETPPPGPEWCAVHDRLARAASGAGEDQEP